MTLDAFLESPWQRHNTHPGYEGSPFNMSPAPEFATAEVLVASLYRALGFKARSEGSVPATGRAFDRECDKANASTKASSNVPPVLWKTVIHGVLDSPKQPNQSAKRFLNLSPVVPDASLYSGSARLSANSWNPGELIQRQIVLGSTSPDAAQSLWEELFEAMSVAADDDVWARWLQGEFEKRRGLMPPSDREVSKWIATRARIDPDLVAADKEALAFPAKQFVKDLRAIVASKDRMTRRQWISLLEAVVRLASVAHVLWLCEVNDATWRCVRRVLDGAPAPSVADVRRMASTSGRYLSYGNPAVPRIRDHAAAYLTARLGINLLLWSLEDCSAAPEPLGDCEKIAKFVALVEANRGALIASGVLSRLADLSDSQVRALSCKKGIGSNIVEFGRHALGQRQAANEALRGYDQGYVLRKRGEHPSAPWIVSLGPVAVLAFVHCCLRDAAGPRSVSRFCEHMAAYGIEIDVDDIAKSDLGRQLRMLGLVLDSPDAESGMLLVPPFDFSRVDRERART